MFVVVCLIASAEPVARKGPEDCLCAHTSQPVCCGLITFDNICWARCQGSAADYDCIPGSCVQTERRLASDAKADTHHAEHDDGNSTHGTNHTGAHHGGCHGSHSHPTYHYALVFMFCAVALGAFTQHQISRHMPSLPYTVVLLVEGCLIAIIDEASDNGLGEKVAIMNNHIKPTHLALLMPRPHF